MRKKLKGGVESIVALIVFVGIVIALIIAVVLPSVTQTQQLGETGTSTLGGLEAAIKGEG